MTILDHLEAAYSLTVDPRSLEPGSQARRDWDEIQERLKFLHIKIARVMKETTP